MFCTRVSTIFINHKHFISNKVGKSERAYFMYCHRRAPVLGLGRLPLSANHHLLGDLVTRIALFTRSPGHSAQWTKYLELNTLILRQPVSGVCPRRRGFFYHIVRLIEMAEFRQYFTTILYSNAFSFYLLTKERLLNNNFVSLLGITRGTNYGLVK